MFRSMRLRTQKARKDNKRCTLPLLVSWMVVCSITGLGVDQASAHRLHAPGCHTHRCDMWAGRQWIKHHPFTGYVVEGKVSTFGYLTGDSSTGITADGGNTMRPCIAIRNDATLDHYFLVDVGGHKAKMIQCDWGPAEFTGRSIDITGEGDQALGLSVSGFPTDSYGTAKELR